MGTRGSISNGTALNSTTKRDDIDEIPSNEAKTVWSKVLKLV